MRVAAGGEHARGLVEDDPTRGLGRHELAVQLDPVSLRIDAGADLDHDLSVHAHTPLLHEALGLPP